MTFPPDDNRLDHLLQFVDAHQAGDPQKLALMAHKYPDVDMPFVIDQIVGRRIASSKLPQWAATQGIVYPPRVSMEQCSSEQAALYKASLVAGDSLIEPPDLFLCTWYLVPWSLYFISCPVMVYTFSPRRMKI